MENLCIQPRSTHSLRTRAGESELPKFYTASPSLNSPSLTATAIRYAVLIEDAVPEQHGEQINTS